LTSIQTSGGASAVTKNISIGGAGGADDCVMAYDSVFNKIIVVGGNNSSNNSTYMWSIDPSNLYSTTPYTGPLALGPAPATTGSAYPNVAIASDFSFIAYFDFQNAPSMQFYIGKYSSSAIQGVCVAAASAGNICSVQPNRLGGGAAAYAVNTVGGTLTKSFNHNSTSGSNIIGNKGVIMPNGVVLQGVV
jgi:hypothetical protein